MIRANVVGGREERERTIRKVIRLHFQTQSGHLRRCCLIDGIATIYTRSCHVSDAYTRTRTNELDSRGSVGIYEYYKLVYLFFYLIFSSINYII